MLVLLSGLWVFINKQFWVYSGYQITGTGTDLRGYIWSEILILILKFNMHVPRECPGSPLALVAFFRGWHVSKYSRWWPPRAHVHHWQLFPSRLWPIVANMWATMVRFFCVCFVSVYWMLPFFRYKNESKYLDVISKVLAGGVYCPFAALIDI